MKNYLFKTWHIFILLSIILYFSIIAVKAQKNGNSTTTQTDKLLVYKGLFWVDEKLGVEVFLIEKQGEKANYNLLVLSDKDIKVVYRTSRNSREPIEKELLSVKTSTGKKYYGVMHNFSRTTIWMALDFTLEGKKIESLTRTFYNSIFEIVPNEQFLKQ